LPPDDVQTLHRLLLYATAASRHRLAVGMIDERNAPVWRLLAMTARSGGDRLLRARCVEMLGLAAAEAEEREGNLILKALLR
jgi:hypothetical protein